MIVLSQTDRSFIARMQPGQTIAYIDRNGQERTVQCSANFDPTWLHLLHHDHVITPAWFGSPTRLLNNVPITDRQAVSLALEGLLLQSAHNRAALITWELKKRTNKAGETYGEPVWIPMDFTFVPIEQEVSDAL